MRRAIFLFFLAAVSMVLGGCRMIRIEEEERKPVDYEVVSQEAIPGELQSLIDGKKKSEFRMTYHCEDVLYLVRGYGQQMSGGYSIQVEELSATENAVFFKTKLLGPSRDSRGSAPSYPYIAVKISYRKDPVQFL